MRTIIILKKDNDIEAFTTLTKLCDKYPCFNYGYIKGLKFPFTYKGHEFIKVKLN